MTFEGCQRKQEKILWGSLSNQRQQDRPVKKDLTQEIR